MRHAAIVIVSGMIGACVSVNDIYLHDPELARAAAEAEAAFNESSTQELWQTMARNVEETDAAEKAMLAKSAEQRFEGQLQNLEALTWQDLWECGQGLCWSVAEAGNFGIDLSTIDAGLLHDQPTQQKIAFLSTQVAAKEAEVQALRENISTQVPVSETSSLTVSSNISQAIRDMEDAVEDMEEKLDELKERKLQELESELDTLLEPVLNPFPGQRAEILERLDEEFEFIRDELREVASVRALPAEAANSILANVEDLLPDELPADLKSNLASRFNEFVGIDAVNGDLDDHLQILDAAVGTIEGRLDEVETLTIGALSADRHLSTRLNAINDLLRKSDHLDLVRLESVENMLGDEGLARLAAMGDRISVADKLDELQGQDVSQAFTAAFRESSGRNLCATPPCTISDVLDYLKTDESKLEAVRTTLRDDFRRATVAGYNFELQTLQRELKLLREIVSVLQEKHRAQSGFLQVLETHRRQFSIGSLDTTIYHQLDCLARSAGRTHGEGCEADTKEARDQFANTLLILTRFFSLTGELREQEIELWRGMARMKHLRSIEASRLAASAHEQFIASGLQGLTAFTEGGITTEQMAAVLRFINTGLLAVIAGEQ